MSYRFNVKVGKPKDMDALKNGTRAGKAQDFLCLFSGVPIPRSYIRDEGKAGRLGFRLMAIVVEGDRGRVLLSPTATAEEIAESASALTVVDQLAKRFSLFLHPPER